MFTKRKLAKLMEKQDDNKQEINYEILDKAKQEVGWNDIGGVKVIDNKKQKLILTAIISGVLLLIILGIYFGVTLSKGSNPLEPPIHYAYDEASKFNYDSVEKYNKDNNLNLLYINSYQNIDEVVSIFKDKDQDVLLRQDIILLDTYERIELNVELKNNYIFDFLDIFDTLKNKVEIKNITINFDTTFDEQIYLYRTLTKFSYQGRVYRVYFEMEGETDWQEEISKLLA